MKAVCTGACDPHVMNFTIIHGNRKPTAFIKRGKNQTVTERLADPHAVDLGINIFSGLGHFIQSGIERLDDGRATCRLNGNHAGQITFQPTHFTQFG